MSKVVVIKRNRKLAYMRMVSQELDKIRVGVSNVEYHKQAYDLIEQATRSAWMDAYCNSHKFKRIG